MRRPVCGPIVLNMRDLRVYHLGGGIVHRPWGRLGAAGGHMDCSLPLVLSEMAGPCMMLGGSRWGAGLPVGWGRR